MIRLGRIGYVNMAPIFFRLDAEVEEVVGVPTALNQQLVAGELDVAPISSIEYARNAHSLRLLPRLCVSSEGACEPCLRVMTRLPRRAYSAASATVSVVFPAFFRPMMAMTRVPAMPPPPLPVRRACSR